MSPIFFRRESTNGSVRSSVFTQLSDGIRLLDVRAERQGDGDWDVDVNDIIDSVEQKGGEVTVFSAEFQPGEQLKNLGASGWSYSSSRISMIPVRSATMRSRQTTGKRCRRS